MKRREILAGLGAGAVAAGLSACAPPGSSPGGATGGGGEVIRWKMVTTWPPGFPGLGTGAANLAKLIGELSGGRLQIQVFGAGELVPAFEVFDAVSSGTAEMGHGAAYYWKGKSEAAQFFASVPFGMNAQELAAWFYYGDGLSLWREVYEPFGLIPAPAGNTGVQMGGWFNKEINGLADLEGLKMRIPGLGGEVLRRAGGTPVNLPGGEIFTALQTGSIDATEWVGPYNDLAFGLHQVARYYYYPGWHEPGTCLEAIFNAEAFAALPEDLQSICTHACTVATQSMLAEFTARNQQALDTLVREHGVELRRFPDDVLARLKALSDEMLDELAASDPMVARVHENQKAFRKGVSAWHKISEEAFYKARSL